MNTCEIIENFSSAVFHEMTFSVYLLVFFYYFTWNLQTCKGCEVAVQKCSFRRYVSRNFLKCLIIFPYIFLNLGIAVFKKHLSVAAFKVIHSWFSFIFILFEFFTNHILEHFLFNIRSLQSVVSFYVYVYDAWTGSMSLNCLYG